MSSIDKRSRDGKVSYLARWRDPGGRQRKKTFVRKLDAQRFLTSLDSSLMGGSYIDPDGGKVLLEVWSAKWIAAQSHLKPSTRVRYANLLANHVLPTFGVMPLSKIASSDVQVWMTSLSDSGLAPGSVRYAYRILSLCLKWAVTDGRIARNPATGVPLPPARPTEHRFLTASEVRELTEAAGDRGLAILTLSLTGMRFGELAAMRVHHVDLVRRRISINSSVSEVHGKLVWGSPKGHSKRSVAIPKFLAEQLAIALEGKARDELAFCAPRGGTLRARAWTRSTFAPAVAAAGLGHVRVHDLRHTAASLMVSAGANVKAVQKALGHASASMTLDVYSGLFSEDIEQVAARLDSLMCPERAIAPILRVVDDEEKAV